MKYFLTDVILFKILIKKTKLQQHNTKNTYITKQLIFPFLLN